MKNNLLVALSVCLLFSCVSSLYPISDNQNDYVFIEALLGEWERADKKEWCRVERKIDENKTKSNQYSITRVSHSGSKTDTTYFTTFLIRVKDEYFMDVSPAGDNDDEICKGGYGAFMAPTHAFYRVRFSGKDQIRAGVIDIDSLKKFLTENKSVPDHYNLTDDHLILTAKSEALKQKILGNKNASFVFVEEDEETVFNRIKKIDPKGEIN